MDQLRAGKRWDILFERSIIFLLMVSLLPSFTALSVGLRAFLGGAGQYLGPINFVKLFFPLLALYGWQKRNTFPPKVIKVVGVSLGVGFLSTIVAGIPCQFPSTLVREWAAIVLGLFAAASFMGLSIVGKRKVLLFWFAVIYGSVLLDLLFPKSIDWLYATIFDPQTRKLDLEELQKRVLTGIFGRQSLAKLLAWVPWLLMYYGVFKFLDRKNRRWGHWVSLGLVVASAGLALATSQRGPFLAVLLSIFCYSLHQSVQLKNRKMAFTGGILLFLAAGITTLVVPKDILETRLKSLVGIKQESQLGKQAEFNTNFRVTMLSYSWEVVKTHPFGNACIKDFWAHGINHEGHAHHLLLQQYRERGWLWGTAHLLLWLFPVFFLWKTKTEAASILFAGYAAVLGTGMFDSPWGVINHAVVLWVYLLSGWFAGERK